MIRKMQKVEKFWNSLDQDIVVNKRELFLGITACTLSGVLIGILLAPKKTVTIGSYNGSNNSDNQAALSPGAEPETPSSDEDGE